jgi:hypothetical protein
VCKREGEKERKREREKESMQVCGYASEKDMYYQIPKIQ